MKEQTRYIAAMVISALVLIGFTQLNKPETQQYLIQTFGIIPVVIVGGSLILPMGIALYFLREKKRMLYAYIEIIFGMFYGVYAIWDKLKWSSIVDARTSNLAAWTALASSIYIVVRGLDNRKQAKGRTMAS